MAVSNLFQSVIFKPKFAEWYSDTQTEGLTGGPHDVDIISGGVVTKWYTWLQRGEGLKNLGKNDYIISKLSLTM